MGNALGAQLCMFSAVFALLGCGNDGRSGTPLSPAPSDTSTTRPSSTPPALAHMGCTSLDEPAASAADREALFTALTANVWNADPCCGPGATLTLSADGTYDFTSIDLDLLLHERARWNFIAAGSSSGTLILSTGDMVRVSVDSGKLTAGSTRYQQSSALTASGTAKGLPALLPPRLFNDLASTCWKKSNDFNWAEFPETLTFGRAGNVVATHHDGCEERWGFGVKDGDLVPEAVDSTCASGASGFLLADKPEFINGLLVSGAGTYRPLADPATDQLFLFDSWRMSPGTPWQPQGAVSGYGSVRVTGRFQGELTQGATTRIAFDLYNAAAIGARLGRLTLVLERANVGSATGDPLADGPDYHELYDFAGARLEAGATRHFDYDLVPAIFGDSITAGFELEARLFDATPCNNLGGFGVPIREGTPVPLTPVPAPAAPPMTELPPNYTACGSLSTGVDAVSLSFSADASALAATLVTPPSGSTQVWDIASTSLRFATAGDPIANTVGLSRFAGDALALAHRGAIELFAGADGAARGALGDTSLPSNAGGLPGYYHSLAVSADGTRLVTSNADALELWSVADAKRLTRVSTSKTWILGERFSAEGLFASVRQNTIAEVRDGTTGKVLQTLADHTDSIACGAFGEPPLFVTGSYDGTLDLWSADTGTLLRTISVGRPVTACSLAPDGTVVATDIDGRLLLYRSDDGGGPRVLSGEFKRGATFSADGGLIAAGTLHTVELYCHDPAAL